MHDAMQTPLGDYSGQSHAAIAAALSGMSADDAVQLVAASLLAPLPDRVAATVTVTVETASAPSAHRGSGEPTTFRWLSVVDAVRLINRDLSLFGALTAGRCSLHGPATEQVVEAWGGTLGRLWRVRNGRPAALVRATQRAGIDIVLDETAASAAEMFTFDSVAQKAGRDFVLGWVVHHRRGEASVHTALSGDGFAPIEGRDPDVTFVFPSVPPFAAFAARKSNLMELVMGGAARIEGDFGIVMHMSPPRW